MSSNLTPEVQNIFNYLQELLALKNRPITSLSKYSTGETWVIDLDKMVGIDLGVQLWCSSGFKPDSKAASNQNARKVFSIPKVVAIEPPNPADILQRWLSTEIDDLNTEPQIYSIEQMRYHDELNEDDLEFDRESLKYEEEHEQALKELESYLIAWKTWARTNGEARQVRRTYNSLFDGAQKINNHPESWQLVLALGYLKLGTKTANSIDRYLFTFACDVVLDPSNGTISVLADPDTEFNFEDSWIGDFPKPDRKQLLEIQEALEQDPFLDETETKKLFIELSNKYSSNLQNDGSSNIRANEDSLTLSPALIFRKKSVDDRAEFIAQLNELIQSSDEISPPMMALIDPESQERMREDDWSSEGGVIKSEDSIYMPLRLNQKQTLALKKADTQVATVIQGPPGTGKTRTIAAMVTHFLAKGERVLVTAQTGQALKEVRDKLPHDIQALAVSNLSGKKSDNDAVQASVNALIDADENRNEYINEYPAHEKRILNKIDDYKKSKSRITRAILDVRGRETQEISIAGFTNTPASLLSYFIENRRSIEWLESLLSEKDLPVISPDQFQSIINLQREIFGNSVSLSPEVVLPKLEDLWSNENIASYFSLKSAVDSNFTKVKIRHLEGRELKTAYDEANLLHSQMRQFDLSQEQEIEKVIFKDSTHVPTDYITELISTIRNFEMLFDDLGDIEEISVPQTDESWIPLLANLREEISKSGLLKIKPSGEVKIPFFGSQVLKANKVVFDSVRISGLSIRSVNDVDRIIALVNFDSLIQKKWSAFSEGVNPSDRVALKRRILLQKSILLLAVKYKNAITELAKVTKKLDLDSMISVKGNIDLEILGRFLAVQELTSRESEFKASHEKLLESIAKLDSNYPEIFREYLNSLKTGSVLDDEIFTKVQNFIKLQSKLVEYRQLIDEVASSHPLLNTWLDSLIDPSSTIELEKLLQLPQALNLADLGRGLIKDSDTSYSDYFEKVAFCDDQIEKLVQELARRRAWMKALQRISQTTLSDMKRYAHANKGLGKGTGKSAARRKQDIRALLKNCSSAVPVWIMPIERIAEQFAPSAALFDVVIVDEASQAGLDALFLLGITKRIIIVGDDKQVSPDSIGIKSDSILEIHGNNFSNNQRLNWRNPDVSLFDECKMAFGNMVTLTEHRRCVPDIIEFSNLIAYMPEKIRLVPLRQTGSASFAPIVTNFVVDGYLSGSGTSITNPPEATAIANKVAELVADPRYKDATIGVISLQGTKQHELIQQKINDLISQEEIERHKIRVDRPPAFQGAERNVILLSLVMVPGKGTAQTKNTQIQRYNVAMSRAQDQVILFHSMRESDLSNSEDLRKRLLTYCLEVERKSLIPIEPPKLVPNDIRVEPFDSLFEQRVYNKIVERGYMVEPQYHPMLEGHDYRIDLVVVGPFGKLAIECDGEFWHGEDEYQQDLKRQNELTDAGWKIHRIRESDFYGNEDALAPLWEILENLVSLGSNQSFSIKSPKIYEKDVLSFGNPSEKLSAVKVPSNVAKDVNNGSTDEASNELKRPVESSGWTITPGRVLHEPDQKSGFAADLLEIIIAESPIKVRDLILKHKTALARPDIKDSVYKQALLQLNRDNQVQFLNDASQLMDQSVIAKN